MNKWLLAAIITSTVVPSGALLTLAHSRLAAQILSERSAVADAIVDEPGATHGLVTSPRTLAKILDRQSVVARATKAVSGPVLAATKTQRRVARLEGIELDDVRLAGLAPLVVAGSLEGFEKKQSAVAVGEILARRLDIEVGQKLQLVAIAPGPKAMGFRRRSLEVVALVRSNLVAFDSEAMFTDREGAAAILGLAGSTSAVETWLTAGLPGKVVRSKLAVAAGEERRIRQRRERDTPRRDDVAFLALARSTPLLALVIAFIALPLCGLRKKLPYGKAVKMLAPVAGLSLLVSLIAGFGTALAATLGNDAPWADVPFHTLRSDLGRLALAACFGLLASPLMAGRLQKTIVGVALAALVALATSGPTSATVVASGTERNAARLTAAARTTAGLTSSGPVAAAVSLGAEAAAVQLVGLDPEDRRATKLLRVLLEGKTVELRPEGTQRPTPWKLGDTGIDDLLDALATHGDAEKAAPAPPTPSRPKQAQAASDGGGGRKLPPIVLGAGVARRIGAGAGDAVTLATAPSDVQPIGDIDPPWPFTFRVAGIAKLGMRSIDDRLAIADSWQVDALGGVRAETAGDGPARSPTDLTALGTDASTMAAAASPFEVRARRNAVANAAQVSIACFLLGGLLISMGRKAWKTLALWVAIGLGAGLLLGFGEAAQGMVGIGSPHWYETLPHGRARVSDILGLWTFLPALVAAGGAALGLMLRLRKTPSGEGEDVRNRH